MDCPPSTPPPPTTSQRNTVLSIQELPNWFNLENYDRANQLDLEGWIVQLYLRQMIQGFLLQVGLTGIVDDYQLPDEPNVLEPITPISIQDGLLITEGLKNTVGSIPPELWQAPSHFDFFEQSVDIAETESILSWFHNTDINKPAQDAYLAEQNNNHLLRPFLRIDLTAPDSILLASFKRWLAKERKLLARQRVQKFTKATLRRWAANQVLPYIDLNYWADRNDKQIPHWLMGKILFSGHNQGDTTDRVRQTTEKTAQEIMTDTCLQAMVVQLAEQTGKKLNLNTFSEELENLPTQYKILF